MTKGIFDASVADNRSMLEQTTRRGTLFLTWLLLLLQTRAYSLNKLSTASRTRTEIAIPSSRRDALTQMIVVGTTAAILTATPLLNGPQAAQASGGATAGRYTTIPIAKRRYYGRVQQGVHEFLLMAPAMVEQDMTTYPIQNFFDPEGTVIVAAKRKDVNGQCTKKDGDCKGKEIRDSRWNDMKASMYLLANAFRTVRDTSLSTITIGLRLLETNTCIFSLFMGD